MIMAALVLLFGWLLWPTAPDVQEAGWEALVVTTLVVDETITTSTAPSDAIAPDEGHGVEGSLFLGGLSTPNDLEFDSSGRLFIAEKGAGRVRRAGTFVNLSEPRIVASEIADAEGLAWSDDGVLFISGTSAVYSISEGHDATLIAGGFNDPDGLAIDESGDLYVADDAGFYIRISKVNVTSDGAAGDQPVEVVIVPGLYAADIDFGPSGELYVANSRDAVWVINFLDDGSVDMRPFAILSGQRALAFDESGTLYSAGGSHGIVWSIDPQGTPTVVARGLSLVEGLTVGLGGILYISNSGTGEILQIDPTPIDASGALANPSTTSPDFLGLRPGDDGAARLPLGTVVELPDGPRLDFLYEYCEPGCFRDAVSVTGDDPKVRTEEPAGDERFFVRHGFINNGPEPLGDEFDVVMYLTRWSGPEPSDGGFELGQTYRFSSDFVVRGTTDQCGPTYRTQSEPQTCEWFVHDFPDGIPRGRYDLWAEWQAPCSAWIDLGFTESCDSADEIVSFFSSGVNSPFGWD
jgi:sugar lactone lactonase YvrE